jgi:D-amino-acid dehydrogenase
VRWVEVLDALDVAPGLAAAIVEARVGFRPVGSDVKPLLGLVDGLVIATVSARPA